MKKMKKFAMLFIVLVGTSLAVYAAVVVPRIRNLSVSDITATTACIRLKCMNTDYLNVLVKLDVNGDYQLIDSLEVTVGSSNQWVKGEFSIGNMQPDTQYYIMVDAVGEDNSVSGQSISFRTAVAE